MTWLEVKGIEKERAERRKNEAQRQAILKEFKLIQEDAQQLLTENLQGPENERLPLQEFSLDIEKDTTKKNDSKKDCLLMKDYYEKLIVAQDNVTTWLRRSLWDPMFVQGKVIQAMFANFEVENYTLLAPDGKQQETIKFIEEYRAIENALALNDVFEPWSLMEERLVPFLIAYVIRCGLR